MPQGRGPGICKIRKQAHVHHDSACICMQLHADMRFTDERTGIDTANESIPNQQPHADLYVLRIYAALGQATRGSETSPRRVQAEVPPQPVLAGRTMAEYSFCLCMVATIYFDVLHVSSLLSRARPVPTRKALA